MTLSLHEFLRRFLLHLLPRRFVRIRHFGFLTNRQRAVLLPLCFRLISADPGSPVPNTESTDKDPPTAWTCPRCGGPMVVIERLSAVQIRWRAPPQPVVEVR
jgi:hypothetical protein